MSRLMRRECGMVDLPERPTDADVFKYSAMGIHYEESAYDNAGLEAENSSVHPSWAFANVYSSPVVRSVFTAEQFMRWSRQRRRTEEANLWALLLELLLDAEQGAKYNPDAIGIADVQLHRRWYISHQAHIQDLLQRYPLLRRMNIIVRWLEQVYREGNAPLKLTAARSPEEAVLLRQIVLSHLRGGELHKAIDVVVTAGDCSYSCILSAAQMQTVAEPWFNKTPLVPLFGEYGNGETDHAWAGNERRLDNLSQLYEDSVALSMSSEGQTTAGGLDALIASVLCGNLEVMEPAFLASGNWRDGLWCHLRAALVLCFSKVLMSAHHSVQGPYGVLVERLTGSHECWQEETARAVVRRLAERLKDTYFATASLEELLQMRVILQFLSPSEADWLNLTEELQNAAHDSNGDRVRLISHLLLCLDTAYNEALHSHSVQIYNSNLAEALGRYTEHLVQLPHCDPSEAMRTVIAMALHLRDASQRASVYAAFLIACRRRELQNATRQEMELLEAKLVQMFCKADPVGEVHDEVMRLLNQKIEPATMLTHNPTAEAVLWRAMHADSSEDFATVLRHAMEACSSFWLAEPHAELDAITDVASIIQRTILPNIHPSVGGAFPTDMEVAEAHFWLVFAQLRSAADNHARITAQLDVALAGCNRTLVFQLAQEEAALMRELHNLVCKVLTYGGSLVRRVSTCVTAVSWLVQVFVEEAVLSVRLASPSKSVMSEHLHHVFTLVEQMDVLGYLERDLLPQQSAGELFAAVRALRMACGQKLHDQLVEEARKVAAAQHQLFGGLPSATKLMAEAVGER